MTSTQFEVFVVAERVVTDSAEILFDSRVICEYLDSLHDGHKLLPPEGSERWRVLRLQALGDGITDAGMLCRYEIMIRPAEKQWDAWIDGQKLKGIQGLDMLENDSDLLRGDVSLGHIAVACAIGWFEFRNVLGDIRTERPKLFRWYDEFLKRRSMQETLPKA